MKENTSPEQDSETRLTRFLSLVKDFQAQAGELLKNPRLKNVFRVGVIALLATQLKSTEIMSAEGWKPTPNQLPSLINIYNGYLQSENATAEGADEGLTILLDLARNVSNNPFPSEVKDSVNHVERIVHLTNSPLEREALHPSDQVDLKLNDDMTISVDPDYFTRTTDVVYYWGDGQQRTVKEPDRPQMHFTIEDRWIPNEELLAKINQRLLQTLTESPKVNISLPNGQTYQVDSVKVDWLASIGQGPDTSSQLRFHLSFTSKDSSSDNPHSWRGFLVHLDPQKDFATVRQDNITFLPDESQDHSDLSVQLAWDVINTLGLNETIKEVVSYQNRVEPQGSALSEMYIYDIKDNKLVARPTQ